MFYLVSLNSVFFVRGFTKIIQKYFMIFVFFFAGILFCASSICIFHLYRLCQVPHGPALHRQYLQGSPLISPYLVLVSCKYHAMHENPTINFQFGWLILIPFFFSIIGFTRSIVLLLVIRLKETFASSFSSRSLSLSSDGMAGVQPRCTE